MQKILTTELLDRLISHGYRYCLSRTTAIVGDDADLCIILMPVKDEPSLENLPERFDTYFGIEEEPRQMAMGVDEIIILVDLTEVKLHTKLSA